MQRLPGGSDSKEVACNGGDPGSIPVGKTFWRQDYLLTPVFLPGEFPGQSILVGYTLVGYNPQGCKELDTTE